MTIDLAKKIDLAKHTLTTLNIANIQANIVVALDVSGSMSYRFQNGTVQEIIDRLLAIGINIDVDNSIDVFAFNNSAHYIDSVTQQNYEGFAKSKKFNVGGGTNYAPVMNAIINKVGTPIQSIGAQAVITKEVPATGFLGKLFGKTKTVTEVLEFQKDAIAGELKPSAVPTIVFFVTDGDNWDKAQTEHVLREASRQGIFWQFIGIGGDEEFKFLKKLDDLSGRFIDNADFVDAGDIKQMSDEALYNEILKEIPSWLSIAKRKGLVQ